MRILFILILICFNGLTYAGTHSMRTITYEDILTIERPKLIKISPDGTRVVFVTERSDIQKNKIVNTLYLWNNKTGSPNKLLMLDKITKLMWIENMIYVLGKKENEYQILGIENGKIKRIVSSVNPISTFTTNNQNTIYYTQIISTEAAALKKTNEEGYIYRWRRDNLLTLAEQTFKHSEYEEIWNLDIHSGKKQLITKFSFENYLDNMLYPLINNMVLSPDGKKLAINIARLGDPKLGAPSFLNELIIFDLLKKKSYKLLAENKITLKENPCWISNNELVFKEEDYAKKEFNIWIWNSKTASQNKLNFDIGKERPSALIWNNEKKLLMIESGKTLYLLSIATKKIDKAEIPNNLSSHNDFDPKTSWADNLQFFATILEDSKTAPQVVLYNLTSNKSTVLTALNPDIKNIKLGKIEPFTVKTKDGLSTTGYLLYPTDFKSGKYYPLIIATYGFRGQTFALNAEEWHSSFPAQVFAKEGYFVLLLNDIPSASQAYVNDSKRARDEEGWQMLKVFEAAVTMLGDKGLVNTNKVGLYGWSHGAFMVEFLIAHSNKFHVASIGEGADYNPSGYWLSGEDLWPKILDNTFGGPPWGNTLKNYVEFSPFFNIDKIKTPLLMEFSISGVPGLEMYSPLRYLNIPAELVIYKGEEHNFVKPKARIASMKRKVDWFNYWLLNKRHSNNPEQYARWDAMAAKKSN
jgi:dipeptidyl aminopeptidase/acylaminoacyl peptidase